MNTYHCLLGMTENHNSSLAPNRSRKSKVKSGCRTCKLRKIKCDEHRPMCMRCYSTGRVCDGYGIWGGGGNFYGRRLQQPLALINIPFTTVLNLTLDEKRSFEWYKCRVKPKVHGLFVLAFWETLLFQTALSEPAVLHAVLAISCVHETEVNHYANQVTQNASRDSRGDKEKRILKHYSKAIRHLQPYLSADGRLSARLVMVTCAVFVCLELLRGNFKTAIFHLESGVNVLREVQNRYPVVDEWIIEVFARLSIQVALLNQHRRYPLVYTFNSPEHSPPYDVFHNFNQAWHYLESILFRILELSSCIRRQKPPACLVFDSYMQLFQRQVDIQLDLERWLHTYERSRDPLQTPLGQDVESFACHLLLSHHKIAQIMVATCLRDYDDESVFDTYNDQFLIALNHLVTLVNVKEPQISVPVASACCLNMSRSVIDIGWMSPLYYVAIKCRVHRIRLQAIRLLESSIHREGFWDARIAACIARKVMEIEEAGFYAYVYTGDDFNLLESPSTEDLSLPPLPENYRVRDVDVTLPDGPTDSIILRFRRKGHSENCGLIEKEYSMQQGRWLDTWEEDLDHIPPQ
ncbi:conserved hypothetical protein [Talaromyces stipitatus ATCC 10500]|uniref:Zn(2)-C6 fungal-type domain-containing protein n=1 Tax=Talaromyces stipitatus (strain ATCC 10500 / CBS 375.48 / QM 6759 / NRRL 1006) TaxID=441959 RepID=B8MS79_TALSN|nr:uncharacterized protein TSTA_002040 [Talaromyces stipitatus ATCC 10500]EED12137.1 conserved hypothetical protein [Talaromyces stipitatus ATCC 10500]